MLLENEQIIDSETKQRFMTDNFLYLLIKKLNLLQLNKYQGNITEEKYESIKEQLMNQYKELSMTDPNFRL